MITGVMDRRCVIKEAIVNVLRRVMYLVGTLKEVSDRNSTKS